MTSRTNVNVSLEVPIELHSLGEGGAERQQENVPVPVSRLKLKLFSAGFSFFVAGTNDGSMGALLPYILKDYEIGTSLVAVL